VSESTRILILFILVIILLMVVAFWGQSLMMKRALKAVIKTFRDNQALTPETAKTTQELGIKGRSLLQLKAFRDYKPTALRFLQGQNILQITEEGKIYLSEETLYQSGIESRIGGKK